MPITINGSGTVTGVSVGGLPDGIVDTDMLAAKAATAAKIGNGGIIQVVHALKTSRQTISANMAIGNQVEISSMSCTITPTSSSNKILVLMSLAVGASGDTTVGGTILRDSTIVAQANSSGNRTQNTFGVGNGASRCLWRISPVQCTVLDSPNTTSSIVYTAKIGGNGGINVYINREGRNNDNATDTNIATSSLTVMEIVA
tara:strand:+ start:9 stop:611 length:603 start_codon:yes stop_codon:yes gene_type:complete